MKTRILSLFIIAISLISCSQKEKLHREIQFREKELTAVEGTANDTKEVNYKLIESYEDFLNLKEDDEKLPDYYYRLAQLWIKMNKNEKAIKQIDILIQNHKNYAKKPEAMMLKAFLLETKVKQRKRAKEAYESLINDHPDHALAKQAKKLLEAY